MDNHPWLDAFQTELRKQALPSWHVRRLMQELSDHVADARASSSEPDDERSDAVRLDDLMRLGDPGVVARRSGDEFRRRNFFQRHPGFPSKAFAGAAAIALAAVTLLVNTSESLARDYLVGIVIKGPNGEVVASPRLLIPSGMEGSLSFQSDKLEYSVTVRAGKDEPNTALHLVDVKVSSVDAPATKAPQAAPRMAVATDRKCRATHNGYEFNIEVGTVSGAK